MNREEIEKLLTEWEQYKIPRLYEGGAIDVMRLLINEFASINQDSFLPPADGAEAILKEGLDDGRYADITDGINIDVKQPFYQAIIRYAEDVVAAQQQPTSEGAEEISNAILAAAHDYDTKIRNHEEETADSDDYIAFVNGAQWMREFASQQHPPAEGAEEILKQVLAELWGEPVPDDLFDEERYILDMTDLKFVVEKFATLHAQRIADKMVSERLREAKDLIDNLWQTAKYPKK